MKSILVATDLSARSDWAVRRALSLAGQVPARLTFLHVVDENVPRDVADRLTHEADAAIRAKLPSSPPVAATVRVTRGKHFDAILTSAEDVKAHLVLIGKHRSVTELDLFRGSTGERIIRFGTRPVLLVKQEVETDYRRIMIATDFSASARTALEFAFAMFPSAEFTLAHAFHASPRAGAGMRERLEAQFVELLAEFEGMAARCQTLLEEGPPAPTLKKAIASVQPDLVVVGTHGRTGAGPLQVGTVAERVLSESETDVLAVRA